MLSYDGVIRKRLRIKGQREIPPYEEEEAETTVPVSTGVPSAYHGNENHADGNGSVAETDEAQYDDVDEIEPVQGDVGEVIGAQNVQDTRTEAQKQHDEMLQHREKEPLRRAASKSYREQVEVCFLGFYMCARC